MERLMQFLPHIILNLTTPQPSYAVTFRGLEVSVGVTASSSASNEHHRNDSD